ncbi:hypothetical protein L2E82_27775 [Cichorium intybus]|uniref:Uncharacterized protein n=1 Tax=Cichorium intybus TaxID=13427 RepID=A0ACB9CUD2_CICIN|nr:hypothetical protein L2E82_27775 [Cichorium intybus]
MTIETAASLSIFLSVCESCVFSSSDNTRLGFSVDFKKEERGKVLQPVGNRDGSMVKHRSKLIKNLIFCCHIRVHQRFSLQIGEETEKERNRERNGRT